MDRHDVLNVIDDIVLPLCNACYTPLFKQTPSAESREKKVVTTWCYHLFHRFCIDSLFRKSNYVDQKGKFIHCPNDSCHRQVSEHQVNALHLLTATLPYDDGLSAQELRSDLQTARNQLAKYEASTLEYERKVQGYVGLLQSRDATIDRLLNNETTRALQPSERYSAQDRLKQSHPASSSNHRSRSPSRSQTSTPKKQNTGRDASQYATQKQSPNDYQRKTYHNDGRPVSTGKTPIHTQASNRRNATNHAKNSTPARPTPPARKSSPSENATPIQQPDIEYPKKVFYAKKSTIENQGKNHKRFFKKFGITSSVLKPFYPLNAYAKYFTTLGTFVSQDVIRTAIAAKDVLLIGDGFIYGLMDFILEHRKIRPYLHEELYGRELSIVDLVKTLNGFFTLPRRVMLAIGTFDGFMGMPASVYQDKFSQLIRILKKKGVTELYAVKSMRYENQTDVQYAEIESTIRVNWQQVFGGKYYIIEPYKFLPEQTKCDKYGPYHDRQDYSKFAKWMCHQFIYARDQSLDSPDAVFDNNASGDYDSRSEHSDSSDFAVYDTENSGGKAPCNSPVIIDPQQSDSDTPTEKTEKAKEEKPPTPTKPKRKSSAGTVPLSKYVPIATVSPLPTDTASTSNVASVPEQISSTSPIPTDHSIPDNEIIRQPSRTEEELLNSDASMHSDDNRNDDDTVME